MAAHRRRKHRPLIGPARRTAATLALAGAATATASGGAAQAEPQLSPAQVKAKVDKLYQQAEAATEKYNGTKVKADAARRSISALRDQATRRTEQLNTSRNALGSLATAQYRAGGLDPAVQLALSSGPDTYLESASLAERVSSRQANTVSRVRKELAAIGRLRHQADDDLADLKARQKELAAQKATIKAKLDESRRLLARLDAQERARFDRSSGHPGTGSALATRADRSLSRATAGTQAPTSSRAAAAVAFAYGALGKPYVWGATGPDSFDCSGLTQAAWRAAGVSLPRTTYTQINAGSRVSRSNLAPGDLVFFYSGVSHVGLYVGNGQMIHAPRPGAPVRVAPIDEMPFAGATRPA